MSVFFYPSTSSWQPSSVLEQSVVQAPTSCNVTSIYTARCGGLQRRPVSPGMRQGVLIYFASQVMDSRQNEIANSHIRAC